MKRNTFLKNLAVLTVGSSIVSLKETESNKDFVILNNADTVESILSKMLSKEKIVLKRLLKLIDPQIKNFKVNCDLDIKERYWYYTQTISSLIFCGNSSNSLDVANFCYFELKSYLKNTERGAQGMLEKLDEIERGEIFEEFY